MTTVMFSVFDVGLGGARGGISSSFATYFLHMCCHLLRFWKGQLYSRTSQVMFG